MSTQSINEVTICDLREKVDRAVIGLSKVFIAEEKFGFKASKVIDEVFLLNYYKNFLSTRSCKSEITPEILESINILTLKYI